jgi:His/Glu/Gln/Arg/opine family amino acid ABC transporter permease subunit
LFDWSIFLKYLPSLVWSARVTLVVSILGFLLAMPVALALALARLSASRILRFISFTYVDAIRGTPLLIQILAVFFVLPQFGIEFSPFQSAVIALALNSCAYQTEILRGGLQVLHHGQVEAARSIGMSYVQCLRRVVLPQVLYRVMPSATNEMSNIVKGSSLIAVISVTELTRTGQQIANYDLHPLEIYCCVALIYFAIYILLSIGARALDRRSMRYL